MNWPKSGLRFTIWVSDCLIDKLSKRMAGAEV